MPREASVSKAVCLYIHVTAVFFLFVYNWDYWWLLSVSVFSSDCFHAINEGCDKG